MTIATEKFITVSRQRFKPLLRSKWTTVNIIEKIGQPDLICSANLNPYDFINKVAKTQKWVMIKNRNFCLTIYIVRK